MVEISTPHIVIDVGGYRTKIGFSGNPTPSKVIPTPLDVFHNKIQKNFINFERHLASIFSSELNLDTVGKSIVLLESPFENQQNRSKMYEIMFETFAFEKVALVSDASMALYSHHLNNFTGKGDIDISSLTGMVIDMGELQTSIVPIVEGYTIQKGVINVPINGKSITGLISDNLLSLNPALFSELTDVQIFDLLKVIKETKASTNQSTITTPEDNKTLEVSVSGKVG